MTWLALAAVVVLVWLVLRRPARPRPRRPRPEPRVLTDAEIGAEWQEVEDDERR